MRNSMRKVEKQMIESVRKLQGGNFGGNTTVSSPDETGAVNIWLFGNLIARITPHVVKFTLAGWNTPTTRSRVNSILRELCPGCLVYNKDRISHFTTSYEEKGREIDSDEWITAARK